MTKEDPIEAKTAGRSLLARVALATLCLLGGCCVSAFAVTGFVAVAAGGAFRGSTGAPWLILLVVLLFVPALLGLVAAIFVLARGRGRGSG